MPHSKGASQYDGLLNILDKGAAPDYETPAAQPYGDRRRIELHSNQPRFDADLRRQRVDIPALQPRADLLQRREREDQHLLQPRIDVEIESHP